VKKTGTVADIVEHLAQKANITPELARRIRIFETHGHRNSKDLNPAYAVVNLSDYGQLCADLRSEDELQPEETDKIVHGFSFDRDQSKGHSYPFSFLLKEGELFSATKERIAKRINAKGKGLEKIKFAVVAKSGYSKPEYLTDGMIS
jgi:ubiquitin carboxyl-terminal hydrolase 7